MLVALLKTWHNGKITTVTMVAVDSEAARDRGSFGLIVSLFLYYALGFSLLSPNSILGNMLF